jgi:uncharacterized protein
MASKIDKIIEVLKDLESTAPDIEASAVVSDDGFIIASVLPTDIDEDRVGAMSATMLALGERAADDGHKRCEAGAGVPGNEESDGRTA